MCRDVSKMHGQSIVTYRCPRDPLPTPPPPSRAATPQYRALASSLVPLLGAMEELLSLEQSVVAWSPDATPKKREESPSAASVLSRAGSASSLGQTIVPCVGCSRMRDAPGGDWFDASGPVPWAYAGNRNPGKGCWCRECFIVWRTLYEDTVGLSVMKSHLEEPANRHEFMLEVAALITLRKEGVDKITSPLLLARKLAIRTAVRLLCVPWRPSCVVPLSDLGRVWSLGPNQAPPPDLLVTLRQASGDTLAVFVPVEETALPEGARPARAVQRPQPESSPLCFQDRLLTGTESDLTLLSQLLGTTVVPEMAPSTALAQSHATPNSKLGAKADSVVRLCKNALKGFDDKARTRANMMFAYMGVGFDACTHCISSVLNLVLLPAPPSGLWSA